MPLCDLHDLFPYKIHVLPPKKNETKRPQNLYLYVALCRTELLKEIQNMGCGQDMSVCCENVTIGNKGILSRLVLCGVYMGQRVCFPLSVSGWQHMQRKRKYLEEC